MAWMRGMDSKARQSSIGSALLEFGLGCLAVGTGVGAFLVVGASADYWNFSLAFLGLGLCSALLFFFWGRRLHFAAAGLLGLAAGVLGLIGDGPKLGSFSVAPLLGMLAIVALFWPVLALLLE